MTAREPGFFSWPVLKIKEKALYDIRLCVGVGEREECFALSLNLHKNTVARALRKTNIISFLALALANCVPACSS